MIDPLATPVLFHLGPVPVSEPVVTTWVIMVLLTGIFHLARRTERGRDLVDLLVETVATQIGDAIHGDPWPFVPLVGTLFLFLLVANLSGEFPGVHAPTARLETAAALALTVFFAVHVFGIRQQGLLGYLGHYLKPTPLMLPLTVLSELTRTLSLTVRLFGNIMSHELIIAILLSLSGLFVPVPLMVLGVLIGSIQAYIFTVLATVFLGAATGSVEVG